MRQIDYIVIHCTAASAQQKTGDIIAYWKNVLGWKSYGYHWLIDADGSAEHLTPDDKIANGVKGYNHNSLHICYKGGNGGVDTRTILQKDALVKLLKGYKKVYPNAKILGHRDLSPDLNNDGKITPNEWVKLCPCFSAITEYENLKP
jgi:N-acetylmuramoyl-L-alanine amidase